MEKETEKPSSCQNRVICSSLSDFQRAEATVEFMNIFRQMLDEARFFSHDERSLRGYLIEEIYKKKSKAEEYLKTLRQPQPSQLQSPCKQPHQHPTGKHGQI